MASLKDRLKGFNTNSTAIDHVFAVGATGDIMLPIVSAIMLLLMREPVYLVGSLVLGVAAIFPIYSYFRDRPPEGRSVFRLIVNTRMDVPRFPSVVRRRYWISIFTTYGTYLFYGILYKYQQPYLILACMPICAAISHSVRIKVFRKAAQILNDNLPVTADPSAEE